MKAFSIFLALFLLAACEPQSEEIPDTGRKTVINGLLSTDSLISVNIHTSEYITDTNFIGSDKESFSHANALILENGTTIDSMRYSQIWGGTDAFINKNNYFASRVFPLPGHTYKIMVRNPGLPDATATAKIPQLVGIDSIDTTLVTLTGAFEEWESNKRLVCNVTFTDPRDEQNYYLFYVYRGVDNYSKAVMEFTSKDPIIEEELNHGTIKLGIAFTDKSINGQSHTLNIIMDGKDIGRPFWGSDPPFYSNHRTTLYFRLYSIAEEYFSYIRTLNLFFKNYNDPLAEPTQVYSNVEGGYGIFAGAAVSDDSVVFNY